MPLPAIKSKNRCLSQRNSLLALAEKHIERLAKLAKACSAEVVFLQARHAVASFGCTPGEFLFSRSTKTKEENKNCGRQ